MESLTIENKDDLLKHRLAIESLFLECFGDRLSADIWNWAYIENPCGVPLVSLCYDRDRLIGHYAIVPMPLDRNGDRLRSYLSMTTMVSSEYRQHGVFVRLANENYARAKELGVDFVMGFPNEMSAPGFKKRLAWNLPASDFIATIPKERLCELEILEKLIPKETYQLNLRDDSIRKWRLSKPGANYVWNDGLAYKEFNGGVDLMYFDNIECLQNLPEDKSISLLVRSEFEELHPFKSFDYQFGGADLLRTFQAAAINRQMCLSDVF